MITREKWKVTAIKSLWVLLLCTINVDTYRWWASLLSEFTRTKVAVVVVLHSSSSLPSKSKLLSYQNKRFFEYLDSGEHPQAIVWVCVKRREMFSAKFWWMCLESFQNVPCSLSLCSCQWCLLYKTSFVSCKINGCLALDISVDEWLAPDAACGYCSSLWIGFEKTVF